MKNKKIFLKLFIISAVFGLGVFAFSVSAADVGKKDIKIADTDGDGISLYRFSHPAYFIGQMTTGGGDRSNYNVDDSKVLLYKSWDNRILKKGIDDSNFCASGWWGCRAYCWAEVAELKQWYIDWKNNIDSNQSLIDFDSKCHDIPRSKSFTDNFGIIWSKRLGENNIIYGVYLTSGNLDIGNLVKFDVSKSNQTWEYTGINLIPTGFNPTEGQPGYVSGYAPVVNGFTDDLRLVVELDGTHSENLAFGSSGVEYYLVDIDNKAKTGISEFWGAADTWKCDGPRYMYTSLFGFHENDHLSWRVIDGVRWGTDHGKFMDLINQTPDYNGSCVREALGAEPDVYYGSKNKAGSPSHVYYADDDWIISDSCQWNNYDTSPTLQQCYIIQRYFNTSSRTWGGDVEIIEWVTSTANGWTKKTEDFCDSTTPCAGNAYSEKSCVDNKCEYTQINMDYFLEPNINHRFTAIGFTTGNYGAFSYNDYKLYEDPLFWTKNKWDNSGFWHAEITVGGQIQNITDINIDGFTDIEDIRICMNNILIPDNYFVNCSKLAIPENVLDLNDVKEIVRVIAGN